MEKKINIAIDIDEVLYPFMDNFSRFYLRDIDPNNELVTPKTKDFYFWHEWGISKQDFYYALAKFSKVGNFRYGTLKDAKASFFLNKMKDEGATISILTARGNQMPEFLGTIINDTTCWLGRNLISYDNLIFLTKDKKSSYKADIYIDDAIHHLEDIQENHPNALAICYECSHNMPWQGKSVSSFEDLYHNYFLPFKEKVNE